MRACFSFCFVGVEKRVLSFSWFRRRRCRRRHRASPFFFFSSPSPLIIRSLSVFRFSYSVTAWYVMRLSARHLVVAGCETPGGEDLKVARDRKVAPGLVSPPSKEVFEARKACLLALFLVARTNQTFSYRTTAASSLSLSRVLYDAVLLCLHVAEPRRLPGEREPDGSRRVASCRPSSLIGRRRRRRCLSFVFFFQCCCPLPAQEREEQRSQPQSFLDRLCVRGEHR